MPLAQPSPKGRVLINGDYWEVYGLDDETYRQFCGEGTTAVTSLGKEKPAQRKRLLVFSEDGNNWVTIVHEVTHAYFFSQHIESVSLDQDKMEEIFCDFLGYKIEAILKTSKEVEKLLKRS